MSLCPVDLQPCDREGCRGGRCERADDAPRLLVCWECGRIDSQGVVAGICAACLETHPATSAAPRS